MSNSLVASNPVIFPLIKSFINICFRRFLGICKRVHMNTANVEIVALLCLKEELKKSSEFPRSLKISVQNMMNKFICPSDHMVNFKKIVNDAHSSMNWKSIAARCGYKQIKET